MVESKEVTVNMKKGSRKGEKSGQDKNDQEAVCIRASFPNMIVFIMY